MRLLHKFVSPAILALVAATSVSSAGATVPHRHHASRHRHDGYRHDGYSNVAGRGRAPDFAPPGYVDAGLLRPEGPQGTGLLGHGGVFGTGYSNGTGLFGIGFFGL